MGKRFLTALVVELAGFCERRWNAERPMVLVILVLAWKREVSRAGDIRRRILQCLDLWQDGAFNLLLEDTELEA